MTTTQLRDPPERLLSRPDWFDTLVLVALAGLASFIAVTLAWRARGPLVWTGTDGPYLGDQMQYLGWIRDAAHDGWIGNPFVLESGRRMFLHPGIMLSGFMTRVGIPVAASYLVWKPVAIVVLFFAVRAFVFRHIRSLTQRRIALVLAVIAFTPIPAIVDWLHLTENNANVLYWQAVAGDMWPTLYLWGYPFTALAVAAMIGCVLAYERARVAGRVNVAAVGLGGLCAWLQPWQGGTIVMVILATEGLLWLRNRTRPPMRLLAATLIGTVLPLGYYAALSKFDASWKLAGEANRLEPWPWWVLFVPVAPLLLLALFAYRRVPADFGDLLLRVWPPAVFVIYWLITYSSFGTFPLHTVQGLSVPLSVLAVVGAASLTRPRNARIRVAVAVVAALAFVLPGTLRQLESTRKGLSNSPSPYLIKGDERRALKYVEDRRAGGVLAPVYLGQTVPALTGHRTWVGIGSWTPDYAQRVHRADELFDGRMRPAAARDFVASTGARFLLSDCEHRADLTPVLAPILRSVRHFGCATVYDVGTIS